MVRGLPRPLPGELTLYVVGPGFGESVVVVLPGGQVVVVDSCRRDGVNLTESVLRDLELEQVDLLIVTHPDLDHVAGLADLIGAYPPVRAWRYPAGANLRELVAGWLHRDAGDARLVEVGRAMDAVEALEDENRCMQVQYRQTWRAAGPSCTVECIAPSSHDVVRARRQLRRLVERRDGYDYALAAWIRDYLTRGRSSLGDHPNLVSLALVVRWGHRRVLLAGDVEASSANPKSGWAGMLTSLEEDGELHLVRDCDAVKVAHHGSIGAVHHPAWKLHAHADARTVALVAPFNRGHLLPDEATLKQIRDYVGRLALTSDHGTFERAERAGWSVDGAGSSGDGPVVALRITSDGVVTMSGASDARTLRRSSP